MEFLLLAQMHRALGDHALCDTRKKTSSSVARSGNLASFWGTAKSDSCGSIERPNESCISSYQQEPIAKASSIEQVAGNSKKRKLSMDKPDGESKRAKSSVVSLEVESSSELNRYLYSSAVETDVKVFNRQILAEKQSATIIKRPSPPEAGALVWSEVVNDILLVHVSRDCPREHYRCLSKRMNGNGFVDPFTGLMFSLQLPADKPELWEGIASFFSPQRPWCKEAYCVARKHRLSMKDALIENIIRDLVKEQRHVYEDNSSDWSIESDLERRF
ncbi:uncharacterized protein [Watersipora subatra]|uniref:uncharacterized protein isoform X2 n=1 Tax=Watersipora subatra TaxID=2589382 RepID=UPI00355BDB10